ncbi:MAG: symmetrical bis(5'-nucleosyl)-tetraphosphatase [Gammaproteobacteria bacterium]|nr:symmetrical bis(5'-nucleosyl)-tetraphosphatase [Gammaproteobacteria bacterium]
MATYAIGDVQGCYRDLQSLLAKIKFSPAQDVLWFAGDLVNRGPASLAVLRFVKDLGERAITVLGNHDLHLLACRFVPTRRAKPFDTLGEILAAPDCDELLTWLRAQPLIHRDATLRFTLVHAGVPPDWSIAEAHVRAAEVEFALRGKHCKDYLHAMYGDGPNTWRVDLAPEKRWRFITNCLTRLRYCTLDGRLDLREKGALGTQALGLVPWFMLPERAASGERILFGHWSTLRLDAEQVARYQVYPLDTGVVWGGALTALRLEDQVYFSVPGTTPATGGVD